MAFQLSPGVLVTEKDFSSIVPAVSTSAGAFAGVFPWGPVLDPVTITSENVLVQRFGKPSPLANDNAQAFYTAANFLSYTNNLLTVRVDTVNHRNAVATQSGTVTGITSLVGGSGHVTAPTVTFSAPQISGGVTATGHAVVTSGVVTSIVVDTVGSGYTAPPTITIGPAAWVATTAVTLGAQLRSANKLYTVTTAGTTGSSAPTGTTVGDAETNGSAELTYAGPAATATAVITTGGIKINNTNDYTTNYINGAGVVGEWAAKFPGALGNSLKVSIADGLSYTSWAYKAEFDGAPGTSTAADTAGGAEDELHIIVIDEDGQFTGTSGAILEKFAFVSKASDNKKSDGTNNYYKDVINSTSRYIWWMDHNTVGTNWGGNSATTFVQLSSASTVSLSGGVDDLTATDGQLTAGFGLFANDLYDISLIAVGKASDIVAEYVINNVAEVRKDCVAFVSPQDATSGDVIIGTGSDAVDKLNAFRDLLPSSSYAVLDSGYKYQYDRYNDKYIWVPLNGDVAGLCARTDLTDDPWYSPGGYNRGQIKNVVKLAVNAGKTERDNLYKNGVNPVVNFPGQGTVLFGDKTLQAKPSAFDRINVRRLFIVLEKAIATAAKYQLFEFNDSFTRAQFKNLVEPFLRDVQGRRGVTDFRVKCDDTNNTGEVIDRNEFVADIFIKPNRSINFITLNFVAARSSVSFNEIGA